jgi:DNA-binding MarR family transcriptional regulator
MDFTPPPTLTSLTTYLLSKTGKAARAATAARLADEGLRMSHMAVLAALGDFGAHAQRDLGGRLEIDPSDLVKVLDDLAAPGWVERVRDTADRRRVLVSLTEEGAAALKRLALGAAVVQDGILAPLDAAEQAQLHALLAKLYDGLDPT